MAAGREDRPLVLVAVEDIFFSAMIESTARNLNMELEQALDAVQMEASLKSRVPNLIILDLNSKNCAPLEAIRHIKADPRLVGTPLVGFLSHVQVELEKAAREAGCERVIARSAFSKNLAKILALGHG